MTPMRDAVKHTDKLCCSIIENKQEGLKRKNRLKISEEGTTRFVIDTQTNDDTRNNNTYCG